MTGGTITSSGGNYPRNIKTGASATVLLQGGNLSASSRYSSESIEIGSNASLTIDDGVILQSRSTDGVSTTVSGKYATFNYNGGVLKSKGTTKEKSLATDVGIVNISSSKEIHQETNSDGYEVYSLINK